MFIPTWLLVLIVVIVVSVFLPGIWDALGGLAFMLFVLLFIVSIPVSLYFFWREDTQTAWIVSLPWIAMVAWGLWLSSVESVKMSLWLHETRVRSASKPEAVERLRRNFADALDLGRKMWQFREDVKYFPSWYGKRISDGAQWASNVILRDEITEVHGPEEARAVGLDPSAPKIDAPYVVYSFSADGKTYAFCTRDRVESYGFEDDADGEPLSACGVWVVEKPDRVVLSMRLSYYNGQYDDAFSSDYVEAFKPGAWLPTLLDTVDRVHKDEHEKHERWHKERQREHAEKNFT